MLRKLVVGPYQTNCYILGCKETNQGLVIDPGDEVLRIVKEITRSGLTIKYIPSPTAILTTWAVSLN